MGFHKHIKKTSVENTQNVDNGYPCYGRIWFVFTKWHFLFFNTMNMLIVECLNISEYNTHAMVPGFLSTTFYQSPFPGGEEVPESV